MHEEVPVSPIQCCQVTFVYGLQKPFWLLHNLCQSSECQSPVLPVLLGPVTVPQWHHRSRQADAGSRAFPFPAPSAIAICTSSFISWGDQFRFLLTSLVTGVMLWIQHCSEKETIQCGAGWVTSSGCALFSCWVLPPSTHKQVNHRWEGGPFLLHGFFGVKDPLELEKPSGVRSCPANTSR